MAGQDLFGHQPELVEVDRRSGLGGHVGHQATIFGARRDTGRGDVDHRGLAHRVEGGQGGVDLTELDPEAPDFDLGIAAAEKGQRTVATPPA